MVINKIDRPNADPPKVVDEVFELFLELNATDDQLDFPSICASGLYGYAVRDWRGQLTNDIKNAGILPAVQRNGVSRFAI